MPSSVCIEVKIGKAGYENAAFTFNPLPERVGAEQHGAEAGRPGDGGNWLQ